MKALWFLLFILALTVSLAVSKCVDNRVDEVKHETKHVNATVVQSEYSPSKSVSGGGVALDSNGNISPVFGGGHSREMWTTVFVTENGEKQVCSGTRDEDEKIWSKTTLNQKVVLVYTRTIYIRLYDDGTVANSRPTDWELKDVLPQ